MFGLNPRDDVADYLKVPYLVEVVYVLLTYLTSKLRVLALVLVSRIIR